MNTHRACRDAKHSICKIKISLRSGSEGEALAHLGEHHAHVDVQGSERARVVDDQVRAAGQVFDVLLRYGGVQVYEVGEGHSTLARFFLATLDAIQSCEYTGMNVDVHVREDRAVEHVVIGQEAYAIKDDEFRARI